MKIQNICKLFLITLFSFLVTACNNSPTSCVIDGDELMAWAKGAGEDEHVERGVEHTRQAQIFNRNGSQGCFARERGASGFSVRMTPKEGNNIGR